MTEAARRPSLGAKLVKSISHRPPGAPPKDKSSGGGGGGGWGFTKKLTSPKEEPVPQSRFVEMFGDNYTLKDNSTARPTEALAPDASPSTPVTPRKPKAAKAAVATTPSTTQTTDSTAVEKSPATDAKGLPNGDSGPPRLSLPDSPGGGELSLTRTRSGEAGGHNKDGRRSSLARFLSKEEAPATQDITFDQMVTAHQETPTVKRKSSLARMVSRDKSPTGAAEGGEGGLQRFASTSSDSEGRNGQGSYRRSSLIRAFSADKSGQAASTGGSTQATPVQDRRRSFAPLGSLVGETDFNRLSRRLSRDSTGGKTEPRVLTFDDLAAEPKTKVTPATPVTPKADGGRRQSLAVFGALSGGGDDGMADVSRLARRSSRDEGGLSRTKSNEPRVINFEDMAAEPQPKLNRKSSIKFAESKGTPGAAGGDTLSRRRSIAPLGASVGSIDFSRSPARRGSIEAGDQASGGLSRSKSAEPRTLGFEEMSAEPQLRRKSSIKFADPSTAAAPGGTDGRRRSLAPLGAAAGGLNLDQLARMRSRDSVDAGSGGEGLGRRLSRTLSNDGGRRLSLARTASREEPRTLNFDDLVGTKFVEHLGPVSTPKPAAPSDGRRRSIAPLGAAAGGIELGQLAGLSRSRSRGGDDSSSIGGTGLGRRLSLSRTRSAEPKSVIGFEDLAAQPFVEGKGGLERKDSRRRSVAPLGSNVQSLDFNQLDRSTSRGGGLGRRLSLMRTASRKEDSAPEPTSYVDPGQTRETPSAPPATTTLAAPAAAAAAVGAGAGVAGTQQSSVADDTSERFSTPPEPASREIDPSTAPAPAALAAALPEGESQTARDDEDDDEGEDEDEEDEEEERSHKPTPPNGQLTSILLRPDSARGFAATNGHLDTAAAAATTEGQPRSEGLLDSPISAKGPGQLDKGYVTYQTTHAREWRRRYFRLMPHEMQLFIAKEDHSPAQTIKFGKGSSVETEYEGSQAEGSFRVRAASDDGEDDYFMFCDSAALKTRLIDSLKEAMS